MKYIEPVLKYKFMPWRCPIKIGDYTKNTLTFMYLHNDDDTENV